MSGKLANINSLTKVVLTAFVLLLFLAGCSSNIQENRNRMKLTKDWKYFRGDAEDAFTKEFNDSSWRMLDLPHDWSIEGKFSEENPATAGGGALPGGIGWYRKTFYLPASEKGKNIFVDFDGVYRNSEVWINGHLLGKRPNGYISFRYDLTQFLNYGSESNLIAVKVDNSQQPNSRWYSGSGIYRNVWLVSTGKIYVDHWGTFITANSVDGNSAKISAKINVKNSVENDSAIKVKTIILDKNGEPVGSVESVNEIKAGSITEFQQEIIINNPELWSVDSPVLYSAKTIIESNGKVLDEYKTIFGIRDFEFNPEKGFSLNGKHLKIKGVCNHHDLGCLGAAVNKRAIERQLEILKKMGCNAIRTSHNPPAPELLDLCDELGFIVMDEAFDMWEKSKTEFDYSLNWAEWHKKDLEDQILRDRNHPSVFIWSIGNEILEQWDKKDSKGKEITNELTSIVKNLDDTRPVTAACNDTDPVNPLIASGSLDIIGYNYHQDEFSNVPQLYPGKPFIATETESSLHTRGVYDMPSDSIRIWPERWDLPLTDGNSDYTCSSYDNCRAPWGSTHEETWKIVKKNDFISGMFTWTGFDYLGEPTPYGWPAKSSYFGLVDLAGFPKDAYYFYQSEWTEEPMLHLFPHWNWKQDQTVDVWAYTNCDEVELFLNGKSLGVRKKSDQNMHLVWQLKFIPGTLKAVAKKDGKVILEREIKTAGAPEKIELTADRNNIKAEGEDLSFITVRIVDKNGNLVPYADNLVNFTVTGNGKLIGVDNGLQTSHESFLAGSRKAYNGLCLAVIKSSDKTGKIFLEAKSEGLVGAKIIIDLN